jgi:hypothetical protein
MPLISNSRSVIEGRPSLLAFVETLAATGVSFWLAWTHRSIDHLLVASALAPFLLLRTRLSTRYSATIAYRLSEREKNYFYDAMILLSLVPLKVFTSAKAFSRHPLKSVSAIPRNYYRQTLVLDLVSPPKFYPGSEEVITSDSRFSEILSVDAYSIARRIFESFKAVLRADKRLLRFAGLITSSAFIMPMVTLSLSFRFAIKSTAILWLPLLWIIFQARPGLKIIDRIKLSVGTALSKVILAYSAITFLFFLCKLAPIIAALWVFNLNGLGPLGVFLTRLVAPFDLPLWQVASGLNAMLALVFFFRANRHLVAQDTAEAWPERWLQREYVTFQAIRTTLSVYAIICTFYIGAATAFEAEWPPIHFILFPTGGTGGS